MPELPEVQQVCTTLGHHVIGRIITHVEVRRPDMVQGEMSPQALLVGEDISQITRHGKQLALIGGQTSRCVCVHLGMTGSLRYHPPAPGNNPGNTITASITGDLPTTQAGLMMDRHVHLIWTLADGGVMTFRDPRRFGGLWTFAGLQALRDARWGRLGPDALTVTPRTLQQALGRTSRPVKAVLLDQGIVAGLGNIYVDEALYAARLHPLTPGRLVTPQACRGLVRHIKAILKQAIRSGGSTIRNYADGNGQAGQFQKTLQVYGRIGLPCVSCGRLLVGETVIGRSTTFCQYCQGGSV